MSQISIITPVYNVENYIHRCIDSILAQTFSNFELILVDDGSPDRSGAICDEYAARDSRITVIHQENRGQAAARNRALDVARGEYIAFVDSDDWVHPHFLEVLLTNLRSANAQVSVCEHARVSEAVPSFQPKNETVRFWPGWEFTQKCLLGEIKRKAWHLWDKLFHRDCFASIRMPEGRINEDNAVVYKILYEAETVVHCDEVLYYYFQNESSTVNQPFHRKHLDWLLVPKEMIDYFTEHNDPLLIDKANRMYLSALEDMCRKVRTHLDDPQLEKELRQTLRRQYEHEKKRYPITIRSHPGLYEILFPRYAEAYWTFQGIRNKFSKR